MRLNTIKSARAPTEVHPCSGPERLFSVLTSIMAIKRVTKKKLIAQHRKHDKDTGSPQVQIAILTKQIATLTKHLQEHEKDHSARRGLLGMVARRRSLLTYLKMHKPEEYQQVIEAHNLKK